MWVFFFFGGYMGINYVFKSQTKFISPIMIVFLCGSKYRKKKDDKRNILKDYIDKKKNQKCIILEKSFDFDENKGMYNYKTIGLQNLRDVEILMSLTADKTIIIHESISTAGEIGLLCGNNIIAPKTLVCSPNMYDIEEEKISEFLKLGFWFGKEPIIMPIETFYPVTKIHPISLVRNEYYTYFPNNTIPPDMQLRIDSFLINDSISLCLDEEKGINKSSNFSHYVIDKDKIIVKFKEDHIKHFILALFSLVKFRLCFRESTTTMDAVKLVKLWLDTIIINTVNLNNPLYLLLKSVVYENDNNLNIDIDKIIAFTLYTFDAIGLIKIDFEFGKFSISNNNKLLWNAYSSFIVDYKQSNWGDK